MKHLEPRDGKIYWHIQDFTEDQTKTATLLAFQRAFMKWEEKLQPIEFVPTNDPEQAKGHIIIIFAEDYEKYGRKKGSLAFAKYPGFGDTIIFDDRRVWGDMWKVGQYDLANTAMHEIGHRLGMRHTKDRLDIMHSPFFKDRPMNIGWETERALMDLYDTTLGKERRAYADFIAAIIEKPTRLFKLTEAQKQYLGAKLWVQPKVWPIMHFLYPTKD